MASAADARIGHSAGAATGGTRGSAADAGMVSDDRADGAAAAAAEGDAAGNDFDGGFNRGLFENPWTDSFYGTLGASQRQREKLRKEGRALSKKLRNARRVRLLLRMKARIFKEKDLIAFLIMKEGHRSDGDKAAKRDTGAGDAASSGALRAEP